LHDLSETALANHLEKFKVINGEAILSVLNEIDSDFHLPTAELY